MAASFPSRQEIIQLEDGFPCKIKKFRCMRQQQSKIEAQQESRDAALDGHGQHIHVELGRKTVDQAQGHVGQKTGCRDGPGQQQHVPHEPADLFRKIQGRSLGHIQGQELRHRPDAVTGVQQPHEGQERPGSIKDVDQALEQQLAQRAALVAGKDVRSFGQVFAFKDTKGFSAGVRGPVSIHQAVSISPVEIGSQQITKSVNGEKNEKGDARTSDTMGMKHFVRFGLYKLKGSINVQLAEKTGFSEEDAEIVKECIRTLFVNDASSARPDGSMEVVKLYWWKHNCKDGQYSTAKVHRSLVVTQKEENGVPSCVEDYTITLQPLEGLDVEVIDGV